MLYKSLKFPASIYLDAIFVELWGIISSFTALLKSIKKKSFENKKSKGAERRRESKQQILYVEEEKRSKDLLMDDILSISDSDRVGDRDINQYPLNGMSKDAVLKSTASSSNNQSTTQRLNKRLKQVKSFSDIYKTGTIGELRKDKF